MPDVSCFMQQHIAMLRKAFGQRLLYVGLQGGYARGDACAQSDFDVMIVLDVLEVSDLARYRTMLEQTGCAEKCCGFICGKEELVHWNVLEICQLVHETVDYVGCLRDLVPSYTREDIRQYVKYSAGNLYHALCHTKLHGSPEALEEILLSGYKSAFYIMQNVYFYTTGEWIPSKTALPSGLPEQGCAVLLRARELENNPQPDPERDFSLLLQWCRQMILQA